MLKVQNVEEMINSKTKMIWIETPTNPMMNIIDIKGMVSIAKGKDIMVCVDNTLALLIFKTLLTWVPM